MADPAPTGQCSDLPTAVDELIIASFKIVWPGGKRIPGLVNGALNDKKVIEAVEKELRARAEEILKLAGPSGTGQVLSAEASKEQGDKLLAGLKNIATDQFKSSLTEAAKNTPEFKALETQVKKVEAAFKCSALGVWVNRNETVLYIVGAVAAVGAGVGMYLAKAGDPLGSLVQGKSTTFELGEIKITPTLTTFVPSQRKIGASVKIGADMKRLSWSGTISGVTLPGAGKVEGETAIRYAFSQDFKLTFSGAAAYHLGDIKLLDPSLKPSGPFPGSLIPSTYKMALGVDYSPKEGFRFGIVGKINQVDWTVTPSIGYGRAWGRTNLRFDLSSDVGGRGLNAASGGFTLDTKTTFGSIGGNLKGTMDRDKGWGGFLNLQVMF